MKISYKIFFYCAVLLMGACKDRQNVDVSHISAPVTVVRIDQELSKVKSKAELDALMSKYPGFINLYIREVLGIRTKSVDSIKMELLDFINDSTTVALSQLVQSEYPDTKSIEKDLSSMYQHFNYYLPNHQGAPKIYTFVSQYAFQMFVFEDNDGKEAVGLGLDMFLHPKIPYKNVDPDNTSFSDYLTRTWNREHITRKVAEAHINEELGDPKGFKLIDIMLHNGKALYLLDQILPEAQDSIIHEYTGEQAKWCRDNEAQMWSYFLEQKLFYESTPSKINKYIAPAPFSPNMPSDAPGRTANYLGYKIVEAYMERYPKTSIAELIQMDNSQEFLEKSKYKPKR